MQSIETSEARAAALSELVTEKFGVSGPDLLRQSRKLGRRVPRGVQADLALVGQAVTVARHPKLSCLHQPQEVEAAAARATAHLSAVDPSDRRRGAVLSWAGDNVVNLLIVFAILVAVLRLRGFV